MKNKKAITIIIDELKHCQIHLEDKDKAPEYYQEMNELCEAYEMAIKALENSSWIPIKTRELTAEEKEEYPDITFMWDCPLPDDVQDVLITTRWGDVQLCTFCVDDKGLYFDDMDFDDVLAWMPLPEPYTKEERT